MRAGDGLIILRSSLHTSQYKCLAIDYILVCDNS